MCVGGGQGNPQQVDGGGGAWNSGAQQIALGEGAEVVLVVSLTWHPACGSGGREGHGHMVCLVLQAFEQGGGGVCGGS